MFNAVFDHYTIKVKNLEESAAFYSDILKLSPIENRTEKPHIRWFSLGEDRELHLVKGETEGIQTNIGIHIALRLKDFDVFLAHLEENDITPHNSKAKPNATTVRADGINQVYFQDPDGYWIEVNDAV
ncbi:VOC family protein [Gracilimonas mengyeensis]|uniref:Glyoxalase/Bleomycin resistance protein/Dioxygenase superfamily protein n=1 Tax=Gracilimonas mengyeensis TaxID=1302730 RepID=A0A521F0K0_9BACT|nr:VOC family protein [Gracilimonas mengyeensis]SMO89616.1 Glyoxalase/Bleomycin resistance protein/Dioxygenase superfamily protein [Gracilimonas mengyeensis]